MVVMDEIFWDTFSYYRFPLGTIKRRGYQKKKMQENKTIYSAEWALIQTKRG